jgi:hypothetical protein
MARTGAYHRIWADMYYDPKNKKGWGFTQIVQTPAGGHFEPGGTLNVGGGTYSGPMMGRRLP